MTAVNFRATVQADGGSAFIELDFDVPAAFGSKGRVSLKGTIAGNPFQTSISPRHGRWYVVVNRQMRSDFGVEPGDVVDVVIERDDEPRVIAVPVDLAASIAVSPAAAKRWEAMSYSHRKQYVEWVESAKKPETRQRRIDQAIPMIADGLRRT